LTRVLNEVIDLFNMYEWHG